MKEGGNHNSASRTDRFLYLADWEDNFLKSRKFLCNETREFCIANSLPNSGICISV